MVDMICSIETRSLLPALITANEQQQTASYLNEL